MDTNRLTRIAEIDLQLASLKAQTDALKAERLAMEDQLIEEMAESGLEKLSVSIPDGNGGKMSRTVYVHRQLWAGHTGDKSALCDALIKIGMDKYVQPTFNTNQLSAWVREFDPDATLSENEVIESLPTEIQPFIKVSERYQLKTRKV